MDDQRLHYEYTEEWISMLMKAETSWGFMRVQLSPTYNRVVQPCYMYMSVSGCLVYSYASGLSTFVCLLLFCQILLQNLDWNTLTCALTNTHWTHKWEAKQEKLREK